MDTIVKDRIFLTIVEDSLEFHNYTLAVSGLTTSLETIQLAPNLPSERVLTGKLDHVSSLCENALNDPLQAMEFIES